MPFSQPDTTKVHTWARLQQEDAASYETFCMFSLLRPSKPLPLPLLRLLWLALHPTSSEEALTHHLSVLSGYSLVTRLDEAFPVSAGQPVYYTAAAHATSTNSTPALSAAACGALSQRVSPHRLLVLAVDLMLCGAAGALLMLACRHLLPSTLGAAVAGASAVVGCWFVGHCLACFAGALGHDAACRNQLAVLLLGYAAPSEKQLLAAAQQRLGLHVDGACAGVTPRLTERAWAPAEEFSRKGSLHWHVGEVLRSYGDLLAAEDCFRRDVALKTKQLPPGHLHLVRSLHTLACALHGQGQERAAMQVLQREAPALHPQSFPLDSPDLAWALSEGALEPMGSVQMAAALAANAEVLAMQRMLLPASHPDLAMTLHIRAALLRAYGSFQSALVAAEEAVGICRARLPPSDHFSNPADHPGMLQLANALHNLAWQRRACGDWPGALQACEEALQLRQQLLSPGAAGLGLSLMQQAWFFSDMGQQKPAQAAHDDAWDVFCSATPAAGPADPAVAAPSQGAPAAAGPAACVQQPELSEVVKQQVEAALLYQQAWLLRDQGQLEAAAAACRQAHALQQNLYPPQHAATAASLGLQALIMADSGCLDAALQLCDEALHMRQAIYPQVHPDVAVSLSQKAWLLDWLGDHNTAAELCRQALVMRSKVFPKLHRDIALSLHQQAVLLKSHGKLKLAGAVCNQALEMQQLLFSQSGNHRDIAATLQLQAWLHNDQGQQDEAVVVCKQGLAMRRLLFPRHHRDTAQSLEQLAWLRVNEGRLEAATLACSEALHMRCKLLPAAHTEIADSLYQQAWLLIAKGEVVAAGDVCQQALAMRQQLLPAHHKDVLASLQQQTWLQSHSVAARGA